MLVTDQMKDSSKFSRSSLYGEGISLILKKTIAALWAFLEYHVFGMMQIILSL